MTTARDIVNGALFRLRKPDSTTQPTPEDAAYSVGALNDMIHGWRAKNVDVGQPEGTDLTLNDDVPTERMLDEGLKALLAQRLAEDFGKPVSRQLARDASAGWTAISAAYKLQDPMRVDRALSNMPSQRLYGGAGPAGGPIDWGT